MLHIIQGVVDNGSGTKEVTIVYEDGTGPCHMTIRLLSPVDMVTTDDIYPNLGMLSADLSCDIGVGAARDLLHDHGVPKESRLWFLNHDGWAPDLRGTPGQPVSRPGWLREEETPASGPPPL